MQHSNRVESNFAVGRPEVPSQCEGSHTNRSPNVRMELCGGLSRLGAKWHPQCLLDWTAGGIADWRCGDVFGLYQPSRPHVPECFSIAFSIYSQFLLQW